MVAVRRTRTIVVDPAISLEALAQACGVTVDAIRALCCPHGLRCLRRECDGKPALTGTFPLRLAAQLARGFGVCLIPPGGGDTRQAALRADVQTIGGE
jgi:hypothetical protein